MTSAIAVKRLSRETWDALNPAFRDMSYRQLGSYAAAAARRVGANSELNGLFEDQTLIGLADVRVKTTPLIPLGIGYLSHAPVTNNDSSFSAEKFARCVEALRREYVERRRLLLRVVPPLIGGQFQDLQMRTLEACGFRPCTQQKSRETFLLDLVRPLAAIRKNVDLHWRRNLAKAEKADIRITRSFELDDFDQFERIFLELTERKDFKTNQDVRFFKNVQLEIPADQKLILHLAWHGQELVAGHLGSFVGDTAIYLLGAANSRGRDLRASYLLHWAVIEYAQNAGNIYYDLGGIDQQQNPGVFRFKQGLNGRTVMDVGPYECSPGSLRSGVLHFLEAARNGLRG
jgi:lipid II:glycine glycyltransferase (peptidoglycan interpeptide bridge formation enzyme)